MYLTCLLIKDRAIVLLRQGLGQQLDIFHDSTTLFEITVFLRGLVVLGNAVQFVHTEDIITFDCSSQVMMGAMSFPRLSITQELLYH